MYFYTLVRSELAVFSLYAKLIASSQGYFLFYMISHFLEDTEYLLCSRVLQLKLTGAQIGANAYGAPDYKRVECQNLYSEMQHYVEQLSEQVFTFHFLCASMAARVCFQLCTRRSSAPGLSLCLQQVSAMQMELLLWN